MKFGMMGWTEDDEVLATARFGPDVARDYRLETGAEMAASSGAGESAEGASDATGSEPSQLPAAGGEPFGWWLALVAGGLTSLAAGLALRRRMAS
jgi:hypothetical protein